PLVRSKRVLRVLGYAATPLEYRGDQSQSSNVLSWICVEQDHVRDLSFLDSASFSLPDQLRRNGRPSCQRLARLHPSLNHQFRFSCNSAMTCGSTASIRSEG